MIARHDDTIVYTTLGVCGAPLHLTLWPAVLVGARLVTCENCEAQCNASVSARAGTPWLVRCSCAQLPHHCDSHSSPFITGPNMTTLYVALALRHVGQPPLQRAAHSTLTAQTRTPLAIGGARVGLDRLHAMPPMEGQHLDRRNGRIEAAHDAYSRTAHASGWAWEQGRSKAVACASRRVMSSLVSWLLKLQGQAKLNAFVVGARNTSRWC